MRLGAAAVSAQADTYWQGVAGCRPALPGITQLLQCVTMVSFGAFMTDVIWIVHSGCLQLHARQLSDYNIQSGAYEGPGHGSQSSSRMLLSLLHHHSHGVLLSLKDCVTSLLCPLLWKHYLYNACSCVVGTAAKDRHKHIQHAPETCTSLAPRQLHSSAGSAAAQLSCQPDICQTWPTAHEKAVTPPQMAAHTQHSTAWQLHMLGVQPAAAAPGRCNQLGLDVLRTPHRPLKPQMQLPAKTTTSAHRGSHVVHL